MNNHVKLLSFILLLFLACSGNTPKEITFKRDAAPAPLSTEEADLLKTDFRYSPPWWQTSICLPDDWQKTLVSKEGALLYDYPGKFSGFGTRVSISISGVKEATIKQSMQSPIIPIVETKLSDGNGKELAQWNCFAVVPGAGSPLPEAKGNTKPPRGDLMLIHKLSDENALRITIDSRGSFSVKKSDTRVYRNKKAFMSVSSPWQKADVKKDQIILTFSENVKELAIYYASGHEAGNVDIDWAKSQIPRSDSYWMAQNLPYTTIRVPDSTMQALLKSSIRNIYQAREIKNDLPVFQVGPTVYRGLWIVDGTFILEAVTFLGRGMEARPGIKYLLSRQKKDGSFEIIPNYWKENGIVLYLLYRHALLTQDYDWLKENWKVVQTLVRVIKDLRKRSRVNLNAPEAGLMPPGFPDGGVGGCIPEYTNIYWNLAGMHAAVEASKLIGNSETETRAWEFEYKDFLRTFKKAAERDEKFLESGLPYLPIVMPVIGKPASKGKKQPEIDPVRGQWAFCHAIYPGQIFDVTDSLALGTMALIDSHEKEGLVLGTGWMADGIWNYFASFWAHAHLWLGHGEKASKILYAFANHASPMLVWREEHHPQGKGKGLVGDMPHNWASAEFIRLTRNLLVLERGSELHLLEGIPRNWLYPGAETVLDSVATNFGPMSMKISVTSDGKYTNLSISPPTKRPVSKIVIHLGAWAEEGKPSGSKKGNVIEVRIPVVR